MADRSLDPLLLTPDAAPADAGWGGKGAALAALAGALPVPPFVAIAAEAFDALVPPAALAALEEGGGDLVPDLASDALAALVDAALDALGRPAFVAVRSSAPDEDGSAQAFAGQLDSYLFVPPGRVAARVADVWRSAFAPHVRAYRAAHGLAPTPRPPAVLLQAMVDADVAGVAFGADPVSGDASVAVVAAVRGLASALVDGRADAETLHVDAAGAVTRRMPARQRVADRPAPGSGVCEQAIDLDAPVLSDADAARVADLARRAGLHRGAPQDVEWAIADGVLWLLQSRPITTLADASSTPMSTGRIRLWDNSNIVESYSGVTTPLTYSFARRAYEAVYREFCRLLRVPPRRIEGEAETFAQMIGLIRGRVYYNLGNWYRVLALLPGYRLNAQLMEGMMGVKEPIPADLQPEPPTVGRVRDGLDLVRSVFGLIAAHRRLPRMKADFLARVDRALGAAHAGDGLGLDELAAVYRQLERDLLTRWDAPLVNDFFAMVAFGLAQRAAESWIGPGALGPLLAGDGDVVSAEPARRVRQLARSVHRSPDLVAILRDADAESVFDHLAAYPGVQAQVADYLDRFGDRCLDELKLESATLSDDPTPLFRSVAATAERMARGDDRDPDAGRAIRAGGERRAAEALQGHPVRRFVFGRLLRWARARVRDRENLRFERTRVFGRARRLVLAMGGRLAEAGRLEDARDVFWLEIDELLGAAEGTGTASDLAGLAAVRAADFAAYRDGAPPPDRFTTRGAVELAAFRATDAAAAATGESRVGLGCCAGLVEGTVRVVRDPRGVTLAPGTVLVAERTDPGWILLFPSCAGLVVERGSLLSHSAIVARELGIPCAVAVPEATAWLRDGDRVRLDGAAGTVERLERADAPIDPGARSAAALADHA